MNNLTVIQKGWKPPTKRYTREQYERLKERNISSPERGYIGHLYGFRGIYFNTYSYDANPEFSSKRIREIGQRVSKIHFKAES